MVKLITFSVLFLLLLAPIAAAQDRANPTVAILRYGPYASDPVVESGILDMLQVYEWINAEERALLNTGQDIEGEKINIILASAGFDFPTVNIMVEDALDRSADILITSSAATTQVAVNITLDQDEPTPVLFHSVYNATQFGITDAPCIKPAHVTGLEYSPPYEEAFQIFLLQNPALKRIGTLHTSTVAGGAYGAGRIKAIGESLGIAVESAAITNVSELRAATQGLANKGVEAIMLPLDYTIGSGLPIIVAVAKENQIPVFHPLPGTVLMSVTLGAGYNDFYMQGVYATLILDAYLKAGLDFALTAVDSVTGMSVGINLDIANEMGLVFPKELEEMADIIVRDDAVKLSQEALKRQLEAAGANDTIIQMTLSISDSIDWRSFFEPGGALEENPMVAQLANMLLEGRKAPKHKEADAAYLASLQCSDEIIAEQQAALDAASE